MATFSELKTQVARDLRDTGNAVWSTAEIGDLINQGIDALADFYPKEIVSDFATISAGTLTYDASEFSNLYRVDVWSSAGSYRLTLPAGDATAADAGWELHGGVLYLNPRPSYEAGDILRGFGYGRYIELSQDSTTSDVDASGLWAVRVFCQVEAFNRLLADRAAFQQWQASPGNTDVTAVQLNTLAFNAQRRWLAEQRRLRRLRK